MRCLSIFVHMLQISSETYLCKCSFTRVNFKKTRKILFDFHDISTAEQELVPAVPLGGKYLENGL